MFEYTSAGGIIQELLKDIRKNQFFLTRIRIRIIVQFQDIHHRVDRPVALTFFNESGIHAIPDQLGDSLIYHDPPLYSFF